MWPAIGAGQVMTPMGSVEPEGVATGKEQVR
jgi:hypothetical protein